MARIELQKNEPNYLISLSRRQKRTPGGKWSEWRDSNPRPLVPQTSALTGLRYTPTPLLIGRPSAPCNAAAAPAASRVRCARLREDSFRIRNIGQRFAQRSKLAIRQAGLACFCGRAL
jgi:hypothetical protein